MCSYPFKTAMSVARNYMDGEWYTLRWITHSTKKIKALVSPLLK